jgi:hypothetical protein
LAKPIKYLFPVLLCAVVISCAVKAQTPESIPLNEVRAIADKILITAEQDRIIFLKESVKQLKAIHQREEKIKKHLDSVLLKQSEAFSRDLQGKMDEIETLIHSPESILNKLPSGPYVARFDSLFSLFEFVENGNEKLPYLTEARAKLSNLKKQIYFSGKLNEWLANREVQWSKILIGRGSFIPENINKIFNEWRAEVNICKLQFFNWKEALQDSKKMEREVLALLNKLPAFRDFMSRNSELARLFGPVGGAGNAPAGQALPGLQSIQSISQELQLRFGSEMVQGGSLLQQQLQAGMDQLGQTQASDISGIIPGMNLPVESNSSLIGEAGGGVVSPAQKEATELKAKPFGKRFEFGWNLQSAMRLQNFPAVRDMGLNLGYKLNPRSVIGVGVAYKFALGESWKNIEWTHEGVGLRSYLDWRLTEAGGRIFKGLWLTGGFEMNYWSRIAGNVQWKELAWRPAGIIGLTKAIPGKKQNGKFQVLFNYLDINLPLEDRISIRWGKTF